MQRQSAAFPEIPRARLPFEEILALVAGDRGASPFENGFEPWTARGGCKPPLKRTFFPRLVCSPRAVSRCPPWPRGSSPAARLAAPAPARPRPGPPRSRSSRRRRPDAVAGRARRSGPVLRSWSLVVASAEWGGLQTALEKKRSFQGPFAAPSLGGLSPGAPADLSRSALRPAVSEAPGRLRRIACRSSDGGGPAGGTGNAGRHGWLGVGRPDRRPWRVSRTDGLVRRSWGSVWRGVPHRTPSRPSRRSPGGRPAAPRILLKEESFLEGFVVPGWGRLGAAGPVSMAARRAERPREPRPCSRPLSGPRAARPGESGSREGRRGRGAPGPGLSGSGGGRPAPGAVCRLDELPAGPGKGTLPGRS